MVIAIKTLFQTVNILSICFYLESKVLGILLLISLFSFNVILIRANTFFERGAFSFRWSYNSKSERIH